MTLDLSRLAELEARCKDRIAFMGDAIKFTPPTIYADAREVLALLQELRTAREAVEVARREAIEECAWLLDKQREQYVSDQWMHEADAMSRAVEAIRSLRARAAEAPRG